MKNLLCLLPIAVCIACAPKIDPTPQRTIIAGQVENIGDAHMVIINYCDPVSYVVRDVQDLHVSEGRFHFAHDYMFAQSLTLRIDNRFIDLMVYPGDSIFLSIDAARLAGDLNKAVAFSGDHAALNTELLAWMTYAYAHPPAHFDLEVPALDLLAAMKSDFDAARDSIDAYAARTGMSDFMRQWALKNHKFVAANQLFDYTWPQADRWAIFADPIFDVFDAANFQTAMFPYHLSFGVGMLMRDDPRSEPLLAQGRIAPVVRTTIEQLHERAPEGVVRDVMLFDFLKSALIEMPELYDSLPELKTAFSNPIFARIMEENRIERPRPQPQTTGALEGIVFLNGDTTEALPEMNLIDYLRGRHYDKVLYIDVWATWCGPCLVQFESAPALHSYFEGKEVVFINLCLDSDPAAWRSAIVKHAIDGQNYFLGENASQQFIGAHNLPGYPSYLILDKAGQLISPAPNPSNPEAAIRAIENAMR